jgi:hypothetical protein
MSTGTHSSSSASTHLLTRACHTDNCHVISKEPSSHSLLRRCKGCREVWYCSREHQKLDWLKHKRICKFAEQNPTRLYILVPKAEGNGLENYSFMDTHVSANADEFLESPANRFGTNCTSPPLTSPFGELLGWDIQMYCNTKLNTIQSDGRVFGERGDIINGGAIYLGCELESGLSRYTNLTGDVYVTGRRMSDGRSLNRDSLWGIMNLIWDAMDLYGAEDDDAILPTLQRWASRYKAQTWVPSGGDGGINVYSVDA